MRPEQKGEFKLVYLITYDLNKPGQQYESLYVAIKQVGNWNHPLESVWFVEANNTISQVRDHLKPHIDANDKLFICLPCSNKANGGVMPQHFWDWLNQKTL